MKRIISLVLILALLPACFAVPVLADETDDSPFIDLLDYGDAVGKTNNYWDLTASTRQYISYYLPSKTTYYLVDVIFRTDCPSPKMSDGSQFFTVVDLGDGLYRAFMEVDKTNTYAHCYLHNTSGTFLEVLSFRVGLLPSQTFSTPISGYGTALAETNKTISLNYPDGPLYSMWDYADADDFYYMDLNGQFTVSFTFEDWKKYDYLDLQLGFICKDVNSVAGFFGNEVLDIEVSPFDNSNWNGQYFIFVSIDASKLDRTSSNDPVIVISGSGDIDCTNSVVIRYASGQINVSPSLWTHWFTQLKTWLNSGFEGVNDWLETVNSSIWSFHSKVGEWFTTQTQNITSALVSHQEALIASEKAQHEADRQLWNTISSNVGTWISNQTTAITNSLSTINSSITAFRTDVGTWITNQTTSITNSISSWGQSIIDSITSGADRIVEALSPNGSADDFNDKVQQQGSTLEDMAGAMGAVTRPDVSTAIPDIGGYLTVTGPVTLASVFDPFWKNSYILRLLLGSLAVSLAFVVIYGGKK